MLISCHGGHPRPARRVVRHTWACVGGLFLGWSLSVDAATGAADNGPSVSLAIVALLLATGVGAATVVTYLLGAARARLRFERALREARAEARLQTQLLEGCPWQTDALHRPVGEPGKAGIPAEALVNHPEVHARLRSRRGFADLQVALPEPVDGSRHWLVRGVPRQDDLGAFSGYTGSARPTDEVAAAGAAAAALPALLELQAGAALIAVDDGSGWRLLRANRAAHTLWPPLIDGAALPAALDGLPERIALAFTSASLAHAAPSHVQAEGWQLLPGAAQGGPARSLLLVQQAAPQSPLTTATAESDNFSFTVSHDLRAPIRVVEGFTRIVKEDYGRLLDRVANDHLDRVLGAAARMNQMIDALLTLARLSSQPLTRQPVNLSQLATYVVDELRRATPEREAEVEIEPGLLVNGDPTLLRLVLENLLGNAWKYSARCAKAHITMSTMAHDGGIAYAVRDNGAGFDMRSSERLFGLFQRLHSASEYPGTGVGLASVKRIVQRHGGDIWAEAETGRGAVFYFTLRG